MLGRKFQKKHKNKTALVCSRYGILLHETVRYNNMNKMAKEHFHSTAVRQTITATFINSMNSMSSPWRLKIEANYQPKQIMTSIRPTWYTFYLVLNFSFKKLPRKIFFSCVYEYVSCVLWCFHLHRILPESCVVGAEYVILPLFSWLH